MRLELITVPSNYGRGANDGAYYPVGLLTIASYLKHHFPDFGISIIDMHHNPNFLPAADVVGISASSTLNYENVLKVAQKAKDNGAIVVLGGQHATQLSEQILRNRCGLIDYVIRGRGETALMLLLKELSSSNADLGKVPNLSWRNTSGEIVHNYSLSEWNYDSFLPLDFTLLKSELKRYWEVFRKNIDRSIDAAFPVFTHFGCGYRNRMKSRGYSNYGISKWCSYCSLDEQMYARKGLDVINEILSLIKSCEIPDGSNVLVKCYGDNVATQTNMLNDLADEIDKSREWNNYHIGWTFYGQSTFLNKTIVQLLARVGTKNVYIGFDSADDEIQRMNGLGTTIAIHERAVTLCKAYDIQIQAGFVLGCAGETRKSLDNTIKFAEELASAGLLERTNPAILLIIPGSPAYNLLCEKEPWLKSLDSLSTQKLQMLWIRHFCPNLGSSPENGLTILKDAANYLDSLSPGPHASMGYESNMFKAQEVTKDQKNVYSVSFQRNHSRDDLLTYGR